MTRDIVTVRRGGLYLDHTTCDRFFAGLETVILIADGRDLVILPVRHAAAGGYLLKRRNVTGDRVVNAADFFRSHGVDDDDELESEVFWSTEKGGIIAKNMLQLQS